MPITLKTKRKKRHPITRNQRKVKEFRSLKDVIKNLDHKRYPLNSENEGLRGNDQNVRKSSENIRKSYSEKEMPTDDEKKLVLEVPNKGRHISCKSLKKNSQSFKIMSQQQQQQRQEQPQNPSLKYLFPISKNFSPEGTPRGKENSSEELTSSDVLDDSAKMERKKIIFVSLNFIKDCHQCKKINYKSSNHVKKPKYYRKTGKKISAHRYLNHNRCSIKIQKPQKIQKPFNESGKNEKALEYNKKLERKTTTGKKPDGNIKWNETTTTSKETNSSFASISETKTKKNEKKPRLSEVSINLWPCYDKKNGTEDDISKINKKYLQALLLSCTNGKYKFKHPINIEESKQVNKIGEIKKKRKINTLNSDIMNLKKSQEKTAKIREEQKFQPYAIDSDSSEIQNPSLVAKNKFLGVKTPQILTKYENPKTRLKKACPEKREMKSGKKISEVETGGRKKEKEDLSSKMTKKESLSFEDFNASDVKELWKRDLKKESEMSLSSHISSTMAVNDELYNSYNLGLQSYSKLKRIVECEITRISKNCVTANEKNDTKSEEKILVEEKPEKKADSVFQAKVVDEHKAEGDGEKSEDLLKSLTNQITIPITKTFSELFDDNEEEFDFVVKKRIHQAERQKNDFKQQLKETKEKSASHNQFYEGSLGNIKTNAKTMGDGKNPNESIPREIVKNWSILHRLEKAFLALGTPNFPNQKREDPNVPLSPPPPPPSTARGRGLNDPGSNKLEGRKKNPETYLQENGTSGKRSIGDGYKSKIGQKVSDVVEPQKVEGEPIARKSKKNTKGREAPVKINEEEFLPPVCCASPNCLEESSRKVLTLELRNRKAEQSLKQSSESRKFRKETELMYYKTDFGSMNDTEGDEEETKQRKGKISNNQEINGVDNFEISPPKPKSDDQDLKTLCDRMKKSNLKINFTRNDLMNPNKFSRVQSRKLSKKKVPDCIECNSINIKDEENPSRKKSIEILSINGFGHTLSEKSKSNDKGDENSDAFDSRDFLLVPGCKGFLDTPSDDISDIWKIFDDNKKLKAGSSENKIKSLKTVQTDNSEKLASKKQLKEVFTKKTSVSNEKPEKIENDKDNEDTSLRFSRGKMAQEKKCEKPVPVDVPQRLARAWKDLNNINWNEREVKERSILSMRGNQPTTQILFKKFNQLKKKDSPDLKSPTPDFTAANVSIKTNQSFSHSQHSKMSSNAYNPASSSLKKSFLKENIQNKLIQNFPEDSSVSVLSNETWAPQQIETDAGESEEKSLKVQTQWEQDINCYRTIVKDIINQYKRTDGFLKHSDKLRNSKEGDKSLECVTDDDASSKSKSFVQDPKDVDIREYRKKIVSEYEAVPIFEYKSLKGRKVKTEKAKTRRSLLAVNAVNEEIDLDVKDYRPNIQKVLDSQIYVDAEDLSNRKPNEIHPSLQEVLLCNNQETIEHDESIDTYQTLSLPKGFVSFPTCPANLRVSQK